MVLRAGRGAMVLVLRVGTAVCGFWREMNGERDVRELREVWIKGDGREKGLEGDGVCE